MTSEQKEEIKNHLEETSKILNEVIFHEKEERAAIKESLKQFHAAADKREAEIKSELSHQHQKQMDDLNSQAEKLKSAMANNDAKGLTEILKQMNTSF